MSFLTPKQKKLLDSKIDVIKWRTIGDRKAMLFLEVRTPTEDKEFCKKVLEYVNQELKGIKRSIMPIYKIGKKFIDLRDKK